MPPEKKARVSEKEDEDAEMLPAEGGDEAPSASRLKAQEREEDATRDVRRKLSEPVEFLSSGTTANVVQSTVGGLMMSLGEGVLQHFFAGARANVGMTSGRYMFELKVVEVVVPCDTGAGTPKNVLPKNVLRVGFSRGACMPILGDNEDGVCFDAQGYMIFGGKRTLVSQKVQCDDVVAVVLNLDEGSPNANTISLFKNGVRAADPQPLPEVLRGKTLFPTVTFKNMTLHVNFGPKPHAAMPFACRMLAEAAREDVEVVEEERPSDGKYNVVFPVCLPDEGTFHWVDRFLEKNPHYTELSSRMLCEWASRSGLRKSESDATSTDAPEMSTGLPQVDDGTLKRVLQEVLGIQRRNFVVMEVKGNLTKDERCEALSKITMAHFRKVAKVLIGEPDADFKEKVWDLVLREKQRRIDEQWAKTRDADKQKRALEKAKKKAEKAENAENDGKEEKTERDDVNEDEEKGEKLKPPLRAELTEDDKREWFPPASAVPDLSPTVLTSAADGFTIPGEDEGFDVVEFPWSGQSECEEQLKEWIVERKASKRVDDIQPSIWFADKWKEWQRTLTMWHGKHIESKDATKKAKAKMMPKAMSKAFMSEAMAMSKSAPKAPPEAMKEDSPDDTLDVLKAMSKEAAQRQGDTPRDAMQQLEHELDSQDLDVFGVDDILSVSNDGEPLFANFAFEDWALLSLRVEMHLLCHAFCHDRNGPERICPEHLPFYYHKYYKKTLTPKTYGMETIDSVLNMVKDTIVVAQRSKFMESQLAEDLEDYDIFVKLTEEMRRDRQRRLDAGDPSAQLHFVNSSLPQQQPPMATSTTGAKSAMRPPMGGQGPPPMLVTDAPAAVAKGMPSGDAPSLPQLGPPAQRPTLELGPPKMGGPRPGPYGNVAMSKSNVAEAPRPFSGAISKGCGGEVPRPHGMAGAMAKSGLAGAGSANAATVAGAAGAAGASPKMSAPELQNPWSGSGMGGGPGGGGPSGGGPKGGGPMGGGCGPMGGASGPMGGGGSSGPMGSGGPMGGVSPMGTGPMRGSDAMSAAMAKSLPPSGGNNWFGPGQYGKGPGKGIPGSHMMGPGPMMHGKGDMMPGKGDMMPGKGDMMQGKGDMMQGKGDMMPGKGDMMMPGKGDMMMQSKGDMMQGKGDMMQGKGAPRGFPQQAGGWKCGGKGW